MGRLLTDDELYTTVLNVAEKAEGFLDSTVGLGVQVDFHSEYLIQRAKTKNWFDLRLVPRTNDRYYSVGVVSTPIPIVTEKTTTRVTTGTGGSAVPVPENTVTEETVTKSELKLNIQLARIWGPLTLRGGVIEGSGGVGIDFQPIDKLSLTTEAFEFGKHNGAYIRSYGTVYPAYDPDSSNPLKWLYLSGGVDDILGSYKRDYFVGLGLRFTDQELRGLVGFVPLNRAGGDL